MQCCDVNNGFDDAFTAWTTASYRRGIGFRVRLSFEKQLRIESRWIPNLNFASVQSPGEIRP